MKKPVWRDDLSTGFRDIDADHKSLFDYLDVLAMAIRDKQGREKAKGVLDALLDYARYHFAREEALFTHCDAYPLSAIHVLQHRKFVTDLEGFEDLLATDSDISVEMTNFLARWLVRHIMTIDKAYFDKFEDPSRQVIGTGATPTTLAVPPAS